MKQAGPNLVAVFTHQYLLHPWTRPHSDVLHHVCVPAGSYCPYKPAPASVIGDAGGSLVVVGVTASIMWVVRVIRYFRV